MKDVIIIGGGLAGLFNALLLNRAGLDVLLIEKKNYPFHRVCGEYVSNEVQPFLHALEIDLRGHNVSPIDELELTTISGKRVRQKMKLGGFGISRYSFDHHIYRLLKDEGIGARPGTTVQDAYFNGDFFEVDLPAEKLRAALVIGAFGKRSNLDQKMNRPFFSHRSPYVAVKYHIRTDAPSNRISLHNFSNGYCGMNRVDGDKYCLCYLAHRDDLRRHGSIAKLEEHVLHRNLFLRDVFQNAEFLWDKPETINEISFEKKAPVENHILMSGDTAGMIAPLCGNGMSMAMHSACILSHLIQKHYQPGKFSARKRSMLEQEYTHEWNAQFALRMFMGRQLQKLLGNARMTDLVVGLMKHSETIGRLLIQQTHGKPFQPRSGS